MGWEICWEWCGLLKQQRSCIVTHFVQHGHTSQSFQIVSPTSNHIFEYMSLWGWFSFRNDCLSLHSLLHPWWTCSSFLDKYLMTKGLSFFLLFIVLSFSYLGSLSLHLFTKIQFYPFCFLFILSHASWVYSNTYLILSHLLTRLVLNKPMSILPLALSLYLYIYIYIPSRDLMKKSIHNWVFLIYYSVFIRPDISHVQ